MKLLLEEDVEEAVIEFVADVDFERVRAVGFDGGGLVAPAVEQGGGEGGSEGGHLREIGGLAEDEIGAGG